VAEVQLTVQVLQQVELAALEMAVLVELVLQVLE
jgi:hypothetical protein